MTGQTMRQPRDEQGTSLVLALVFVFAIGLVLVAITSFAGAASTNTANLRSQRAIDTNADVATTAAMDSVRRSFTPAIYTGGGTLCASLLSYNVYCIGQGPFPIAASRTVQFYTCGASVSQNTCLTSAAAQAFYASVTYDDIPPTSSPPGSSQCNSPTNTATCGILMTINRWDVRGADN